jgi:hypothetical protein
VGDTLDCGDAITDNGMALNWRVAGLHNAYSYDAVGRVDSLSFIRPTVADNAVFTFGYNPASQIASRATNNDAYVYTAHYDVDRNYSVNGLNQYTAAGPAAFTYDDNGNLTGDGAVTFTITPQKPPDKLAFIGGWIGPKAGWYARKG